METNENKIFYVNLKNKELFEILGRHVKDKDLAFLRAIFKFNHKKQKSVINLIDALVPVAKILDDLEDTGVSSGEIGYISFIKDNALEAYFALNELRSRDYKLSSLTTPNGYICIDAFCSIANVSDAKDLLKNFIISK